MSETRHTPPVEVAAQRRIGDQTDSLDAIRSVWERAGDKNTFKPPKTPKPTEQRMRRPLLALPGLIVIGCLMVFFAVVSAEPFWLGVGKSESGTVTVDRCEGGDFAPRCIGTFDSAESDLALERVRLTGNPTLPDGSALDAGDEIQAVVTGSSATTAYNGDTLGLHLRWIPGFTLVLLGGLLLVPMMGAWRLDKPRRALAVLSCFAAPVVLLLATLAVTW
ncbi:hypothetical protein [Natronoglycomyces albus]|uniref:Uncharacterized protein n=1 Tax=Natronoglycomyces albus TaxID=2811108 RepID=A0A895XMX4_9ACTN|nr:hypothetical protein [Natronoglycomyces albus]QSB04883.1 hypothetical protein JQS30_14115 [Natronoglycomyces albus]